MVGLHVEFMYISLSTGNNDMWARCCDEGIIWASAGWHGFGLFDMIVSAGLQCTDQSRLRHVGECYRMVSRKLESLRSVCCKESSREKSSSKAQETMDIDIWE